MSVPVEQSTLRTARRAKTAVYLVFAINGFAFSSWMARIPHVRDNLMLEPGELGRLLLAIAFGAILALPTAGLVVSRIGAARTVAAGALSAGVGLVVAAVSADPASSVVATAIGLFAIGYGTGSWDVAMNVEAAAVERQLHRHIMPRFHAAFSLGTVLGAASGAGLAWLGVTVIAHLATVGVLALISCMACVRYFLPHTDNSQGADVHTTSVWRAWREPRTLLIGVMVLCFALVEGIANDWLAVGLVDGYGVSNAAGSAGFAVFVTGMTLGRTVGPWLLDRYGRARTVSVSGFLAAGGALLVVFGGTVPIAIVGTVVWGLGAALGFPVGMSAAADEPEKAPARVAVVSSIGYTAFLAGPPLLGWIGDHEGVLQALLVVAAAGIVGSAVAGASRRPEHQDQQSEPVRS